MRITLAAIVAVLAMPTPAVGIAAPVMDDPNGGTPWSCAWNPYAQISCNGGSCWWAGEYQWRSPYGNFTGERCA